MCDYNVGVYIVVLEKLHIFYNVNLHFLFCNYTTAVIGFLESCELVFYNS